MGISVPVGLDTVPLWALGVLSYFRVGLATVWNMAFHSQLAYLSDGDSPASPLPNRAATSATARWFKSGDHSLGESQPAD